MAAIIASIDLTTSLLISWVCDKACWARVWTAASTADLASSVLGLNSFYSNEARSLPSNSTAANVELV